MGGLSHMQGVSGHIERNYEAIRENDKPRNKRDSCRICANWDSNDGSCSIRPINRDNNLNLEWKKCSSYNPWK